MMPLGDGSYRLYMNGEVREASNLRVGDDLVLHIEFDDEYKGGPEHPMPSWFHDELSRSPLALQGWEKLPPSRRKEIIRYFVRLKSEPARRRNTEKALHVLSGGAGRFMAREWNADAVTESGRKGPPGYSTKELTLETLPDFESFFKTHPAPGAFGCWCMYHHALPSRTSSHSGTKRQKENLVRAGRSHGILVYSEGEPVGWCQFGLREDLPRVERGASYRRSANVREEMPRWRITCFTVGKGHRGHGVARIALKAALDAIRRKGGGLVEAYPVVRRGAYREYLGSVSMFEREGFRTVTSFGQNNAVMQKCV